MRKTQAVCRTVLIGEFYAIKLFRLRSLRKVVPLLLLFAVITDEGLIIEKNPQDFYCVNAAKENI